MNNAPQNASGEKTLLSYRHHEDVLHAHCSAPRAATELAQRVPVSIYEGKWVKWRSPHRVEEEIGSHEWGQGHLSETSARHMRHRPRQHEPSRCM